MKKVLAITLILVLLVGTLGLTACGETKGENEVWIGVTNAGFGIKWLEKSIAEFHKLYPGYKVTIHEESPNFDQLAEQQLQMPSTAPNDIYIISEIWWKTQAKKGQFMPLDNVYASDFNEDFSIEDAMREANIAEARINGHYYAINYASTASGLIYNKTIADYYENLPQWGSTPKMEVIKERGTVDMLVQWMEKIELLSKTYYNFNTGKPGYYLDGTTAVDVSEGKPAVYPISYPGMYDYWSNIINTWWAQAAGETGFRDFYNYDGPEIYADQARLKALQAFEKLKIWENSVPGSIEADHIKAQNEFLRGHAALIPCGDWMYYESKQNAELWQTEFEMIYLPVPDTSCLANRKYIWYSDGGLCVVPNKEGINMTVVEKFLSYLFSEKGCLNYTEETESMWGFDGTENPTTNYATQLVEEGAIGTFNKGVMDLVNGSTGQISIRPSNLDAPNAVFAYTSGVGGPWPGADISEIRDGTSTAEDVFYGIISRVGGETENHDSSSEWDRWWKIVHVNAQ